MQQVSPRLTVVLAALLAVFALKGVLVAPPAPPASVQPGEFDTERSLGRLARILGDQRPHPVDTPANDRVRERLVGELRSIGLDPEVRQADDCYASPRARIVSCSHVNNVVASIGPVAGPRLLINAHYDSSPAGPGAADDGMGVATLLEVAALLRSKPPARPVTFLFNEGEEFGLNGAGAFAALDPLARSVDSLINIEARGVSGPATMFETNTPNGAAIAAYAGATRRPNANSIATDMATLIPNTTDVEVFKNQRWTTLSYAIIGNETRYHTPGDRVEALDRASLHQMGSEVLAATRKLGARSPTGQGRTVFTDVAGLLLISLPLTVAVGLLAAMSIAWFVAGWKSGALKRPLVLAATAWVVGLLAAATLSLLFGLARPGAFWRAHPIAPYLAVYAAICAAQSFVLMRQSDRSRPALRTAAWVLTVVLGAVTTAILPGASIFFLIAPGIALLGVAIRARAPKAGLGLIWAAAVVQLLMIVQLLAMLELLLVDGPLWAVAPLASLAVLPFFVEIAPGIDRRAFFVPAAMTLIACVAALLVPRTSSERPGRLSIEYLRDDVAGRSDWAVSNGLAPLPDGWSAFGDWQKVTLRNSMAKRWLAPAPKVDTQQATLAVRSSTAIGAIRKLVVAIDPHGQDTVGIRFAKGVPITAMGLAGKPRSIPASAGKGPTFLRCAGRSCARMLFEIHIKSKGPVIADLIGSLYALPHEGAALRDARPMSHIPQYQPDGSTRIVPVRL
jgi:hypothetical protein